MNISVPASLVSRFGAIARAIVMGALVWAIADYSVAQAVSNDAWSTTPTDNTFSGINWTTGATTPGTATGSPASGDNLYFGTSSITTLNDDETGFSFGSLTFNSGASTFTIGGDAFTLGTGTAATVLTNSSGVLQTINDNIQFGNSVQTIVPGTGGLTLGGTTSVAGTASGLTLSGAGTLTLNASGTISGTTLTGIVTLGNTAGETLAIANNSTVSGVLTGGGTTGGTLSIASGSTYASITTQNNLSFNGTLTGAGTLELGDTATSPKYTIALASASGFTGVIDFAAGDTRLTSLQSSSPTYTIELAGGGEYTNASPGTIANNIELASTGGYIRQNNSGTTAETLSGAVTGTGTFVLANTNYFTLSGNWTSSNAFSSAFGGTVNIGDSSTTDATKGYGTVNILTTSSSDANAAYVLINGYSGETGTLNSTLNSNISGGGTVNLGSLASTLNGTYGGIVENNVASTTATFSIGNLNTNTSYAGVIQDGTGTAEVTAVAKVGTGTLTLTGANTYTGGTTISGGAVNIQNTSGSALGTGATTVASGGALTGGTTGGTAQTTALGAATSTIYTPGVGAITGALTINSGGALTPGNAGIGTITTGALTINSGALLNYEFSGTANDFTSAGALTVNGGTVDLYAVGTSTPYAATGLYDLFRYTSLTGLATNLIVGDQVAGYSYTFSNDATDGLVQLQIAAVPEPGTWALLVMGLVVMAVAAYYRRKNLATV